MTPEQTLKLTESYQKNMEKARRMSVNVGITKSEATRRIYDSGANVVEVGVKHEYGLGVPRRSFLRVPFRKEADRITKAITESFRAIAEQGADAETQITKIGVFAENISKAAFRNEGYGTWPNLAASTIEVKGSAAPLIDTGTLRNSITSEVVKG